MKQPDKAAVKAFYDKHYYANVIGAGEPTTHHRQLAKRIALGKGDKVLDVACGTGAWLKAAQKRGAEVSGIDLSERAIEFCRWDNSGGQYFCQSADSLPFETGYFDWVTCLGSLEHFPEKSESLAEMARVMKPGGHLLISVPNSEFVGYLTGLYRGTNQAQVIETPLKISEWEALGEGAGLTLERKWRDLHFMNRDWILQNGWSKALPRLVAASVIAVLPMRLQYQVYFCFRK